MDHAKNRDENWHNFSPRPGARVTMWFQGRSMRRYLACIVTPNTLFAVFASPLLKRPFP